MTKEKEYGHGVEQDMEVFMDRLSEAIIEETYRRGLSVLVFSELQNVGRNIVGDIVNRKKRDVRLSTIFKLCDHTNISFEDLLKGKESNIGDVSVKVGGKLYYAHLKCDDVLKSCKHIAKL